MNSRKKYLVTLGYQSRVEAGEILKQYLGAGDFGEVVEASLMERLSALAPGDRGRCSALALKAAPRRDSSPALVQVKNPYEEGTEAWQDWQDGWDTVMFESEAGGVA